MGIQALILPALAALHNFIRIYRDDPEDIDTDKPFDFSTEMGARAVGELEGRLMRTETIRANKRRDKIVGDMWEQYRHHLASRAAHKD